MMPNHSSFLRQSPTSPLHTAGGTGGGQQPPSRKPSIVEILSSPPPLPMNTPDHEDVHSFSLSRNASVSSRASSVATGSTHNQVVGTNGLDWYDIPLYDLAESNKLISINSSYSVQRAFQTLVKHNLTSVPVSLSKDNSDDLTNCLTFDYSDLNTYLLLIMNRINLGDLAVNEIGDPSLSPKQKHDLVLQTINKAKRGEEVPVDFIVRLHPKNPFVKFYESETLFKVVEVLGSGVHRVAITDVGGKNIVGILSQRRLIKYLWDNARRFPSLEFYLNSTLQDLQIGSSTPITIYEDQMLIEALHKMFNERVTSLAVIDRAKSLIGNISIVDVKNVSSSKESHLLFKSVLNFISYNLSQKGIDEGQDQYPIFHVNTQSSLGRVIAKLVATQSHRLWVVESRVQHNSSVSSSSSSTPLATPTTVEAALNQPPSASNEPMGLPGKLIGVVTLTDILGLFASLKGKKTDPLAARNQRRRSSTSTRSSFEAPANANQEMFRKAYVSDTKNESVFSKD
ncbi:uncharacterized protein PRCAT00001937001 [Priceomyces carsonii]|uniref:uncharacterized protein n=1 Tax=Priceomyces carsonii TaxID=28549 RepID=UPI002EDBAB57|nr:unnamed protein product [Priceomyces carsonii]